MNISVVKPNSIENGEGVRVSVFVSGCRRHCKNCFNPETWDFNYGKTYLLLKPTIYNCLNKPYIQGLTILGGEPFEDENLTGVLDMIDMTRNYLPDKDIWIYSGYTLEQLLARKNKKINEILKKCDVLVDGPFIETLKNPSLKYRGSENQRIIYLHKENKNGKYH